MSDHRRWWALAALSGVLGLVVLDETVVGVALVRIRSDLSMSQVESHWVVNAYLLVFTCFVAIGGRLSDSIGQRPLLLAGIVIFGAGSLAAGAAENGGWLIASRVLQGFGAAVVFPSSLAVATEIFPPSQRGFALGIQTTIAAVFMSMGPLVGGFLLK